jgi:hypothetical protein
MRALRFTGKSKYLKPLVRYAVNLRVAHHPQDLHNKQHGQSYEKISQFSFIRPALFRGLFYDHKKEILMDAVHPIMQQALRPYRPLTEAEYEAALKAAAARQRAIDERRWWSALCLQQDQLSRRGELP